MSKKLYVTTMTVQAVVYADSPEEAQHIAHRVRTDVARQEVEPRHITAADMTTLPEGWDERCYPFGQGTRTIGEILRGEVKP